MPAPVLNCPKCESRVSSFDQYCGVCGAVLASLGWSTPEEKAWHFEDGHVAVRAGARSALVRFRNEGVVPAGLVLRAEELPDWIDREALEEKIGQNVLILLPSASGMDFAELEIPLVTARLAPLFEEEESATARDLEREAHLPFLTNLNDWHDGHWTSRPFKLTLLATRRPWISPARSHYRFLPVERLEGGGLEHQIELHNETIRALDLFDVRISDDPETPTPSGYERLPADAILHRATLEQQRIEAGESWSDVLRLVIAEPRDEEALQWFAALIEYKGESVQGKESHTLACRIQGRVGRGPTLRVKGPSTLTIQLDQIHREHAFILKNPGQIPVAIEALEILREGDDGKQEPAPERDWLSLAGVAAGEVLEPGEERTLQVRVQPSMRPRDEFTSAESQRQVRIRHDGLPSPAQSLDLEVFVSFGRAKEFIAGIDFGTTNSVVCIGGAERSYALRLDRVLNQDVDRIRSLMYFEGSKRGGTDGGFLFGEAAFSSAAVRPENLVRSIKTVVARDPRTRYVFYRRISGLGEQRVTKTPQDLLDLFISELRTRAEEGVSYLPGKAGEDLKLEVGTQIALSRAVFSHPVEITNNARRALMEAAHGAGINETVREIEDFFETNCIDEATAAVLSYVQGRVQDPPILNVPPMDCERVLCFDMGGGTTDLATVEVLDMAKFLADPMGDTRVVVNLEAKAGAPFGGDDLDEMLAATILSEVRRQSEEQGAPVILDDIERAIRANSYSDFKTDFLRRRNAVAVEQEIVPAEARTEDEALRLYKLATDVLAKAEEVKRRLSTAPEGLVDLPGTEWPREKQDSQAEAKNFVVHLERAAFEPQVRERIRAHLHLLDSVVRGAGWEWSSVTTLLFTGQSARVPCIREEVALYVAAQRGPEAPALLPEPDPLSFDPKNCVAIGAAIWGANRYEGSWVDIRNGVNTRLTFDIETRIGPRFRPVKGLQRGRALPAEGTVSVQKGMDVLTLHRNQNREPYVKFRFPALQKTGELMVRVNGPSDYAVVVDGREIKGEIKV